MTTARATHYNDLSGEYLRKARAHLAEGDLTQASEKGWGAAAVAVKAIAEARELDHTGHRELWRVVRLLVRETGDKTSASPSPLQSRCTSTSTKPGWSETMSRTTSATLSDW